MPCGPAYVAGKMWLALKSLLPDPTCLATLANQVALAHRSCRCLSPAGSVLLVLVLVVVRGPRNGQDARTGAGPAGLRRKCLSPAIIYIYIYTIIYVFSNPLGFEKGS